MNGRASGQSIVEFGLIAPILLLLAMSVWDGGSVLREQVILQQAARDGARAAGAAYASSTTQVACAAPAAIASSDQIYTLMQYSALDMSALFSAAGSATICNPTPQTVQVNLQYAHTLITPILREVWGGGTGVVVLHAKATFYLPSLTPVPSPVVPSTPLPTLTPIPPTATPTPTATPVPPTATATPVPPSATPTATATPLPATATRTATATPVPPTATATVAPTAVPTATPAPPTSTPLPATSTPTGTATVTATATPSSVPLTAYAKSVMADGPVLYWPLDESPGATTTRDLSGHGYDGTYVNGFASVTSAVSGDPRGTALNGGGQLVQSPDVTSAWTAAPRSGDTSMTLEVWFNPTAAGIVVDEHGPGASPVWHDSQIEVESDGRLVGSVWGSSSVLLGKVSFGTWHYAALRYNASTQTLDSMLDGVLTGSQSGQVRQAPWNNSSALSYALGQADVTNNGSGSAFTGAVDEFAVYNTALPTARLQAHFQAGGATIPTPVPTSTPTATATIAPTPTIAPLNAYGKSVMADGPVLYWPLDESPGATTTRDLSGHGYDGTYVNGFASAASVVSGDPRAVALNGSGQLVQSPDVTSAWTAAPRSGDTSMTLEVWFNPTAAGIVVDEHSPGASPGWHDSQIEVESDGRVLGRVWNGSPILLGKVGFGTWHYAALRYNASTQTLDSMLDGVLAGSQSGQARQAPWNNGAALSYALGQADVTNNGSGSAFTGAVDEFAVYNTALATARLQAHYQAR